MLEECVAPYVVMHTNQKLYVIRITSKTRIPVAIQCVPLYCLTGVGSVKKTDIPLHIALKTNKKQ